MAAVAMFRVPSEVRIDLARVSAQHSATLLLVAEYRKCEARTLFHTYTYSVLIEH